MPEGSTTAEAVDFYLRTYLKCPDGSGRNSYLIDRDRKLDLGLRSCPERSTFDYLLMAIYLNHTVLTIGRPLFAWGVTA